MKYHPFAVILLVCTVSCGSSSEPSSDGRISGALRVWHPLTIDFQGPQSDELADVPNPFLDYRMQVAFTGPSRGRYDVPGYFSGDGKGNSAGNVWRVRFTPDEAGEWTYDVSFRQGDSVAVAVESGAGEPAGFCDSARGSFAVAPRDETAPNFSSSKFGELV